MSKDRFSTLLPNERLKQERLLRGWTQADVAGFIGTDGYTVNRWERGRARPRSYFCQKLCDLFGKSVEDLGLAPVEYPLSETIAIIEMETSRPFYWHVPHMRNPFFTGREGFLVLLHAHLRADQASVPTRVCALYGLGGIGKTQLAVEYAYRYALAYQAVFWINAESVECIIASFLNIAKLLRLPVQQETDPQHIVSVVHSWLVTHKEWLLIWDNLEEMEILQRFSPTTHQGAILITTQNATSVTAALSLELPPLSPDEGARFLLNYTRNDPFSEISAQPLFQRSVRRSVMYTAARELAITLGGLPLALDQARIYIEENGCTLPDYMQRYEQQPMQLLDRRGTSKCEHPRSALATFGHIYRRLTQDFPHASDLLCMCAFLYADAIPEELFFAHSPLVYDPLAVNAFATNAGPWTDDSSRFDLAIATLRSFSLLQRHAETRTLSIHPLTQVALRGKMSEQEWTLWHQRVVRRLDVLFPEVTYVAWRQCERLLPHILMCLAIAPNHRDNQEMARIRQKAALYLRERNKTKPNQPLYQQVLNILEQKAAPEPGLATTTLHELAQEVWQVQEVSR